MPLPVDLKRCCRVTACLSAALGLIAAPVAGAAAEPRKTAARAASKNVKAATPPASKEARPAAVPAAPDPVTEIEIISDEALALGKALEAAPEDAQARQKLAELALRATRATERALARGEDFLLAGYRSLFGTHFAATRPALEAMAGRGIGGAEFALGVIALHGFLEPPRVERACAHFAAALAKGFSGAKFRHAQCIEVREPARALALLREAATAGHGGASEQLGRICLEAKPQDAACARAYLERAAGEGRPGATTLLGRMHAEGIGGKANLVRAAAYYREAAQRGDAAANNSLGELYEAGRGLATDPAKAFDHYLLAALAGFPAAKFNLGRLYAAGKGTTKNLNEARRWLGEAARAGFAPAQQILDSLE